MMASFAASGAAKHLTFLLGAGASTASGLPDWDELALRLLLRSGAVADPEAAKLLVSRQDPLLVAESSRKAGGDDWNGMVQSALYDGVTDPTPSALHVATSGYLLDGEGGDTTLITLNFDTLLEDAIRQDTTVPVESRADGGSGPDAYLVHHLHGVVSSSGVLDVVLTLSDFNELLGDDSSWQVSLLKEAVRRGGLVIVGTSYRDPDVRRWLHLALAEQPNEHAAIVMLTREGFALSRGEFRLVKDALAGQWEAIGLTPVILEDFTDAAQIVRELRHVHDHGYRSPQERAGMIWDAHAERFDVLQDAYSDQLATDADALREVLGVESLNLTLWLADADGHLARWASQDRRYRSGTDLRMIDSGHDSWWVAGRALGAQTVRFQDLEPRSGRRWTTVLAVPVRVEHSGLPDFATAVISVGLPGSAENYADPETAWLTTILEIANEWSGRLVQSLDPAAVTTLN